MEDFISRYDGRVIGDGECGALVRQYWIEVDGFTPPSYPSAKNYWTNPVPGYVHTSSPKPGDIAVYDGHGVYTDGHIAVYVGGQVFEQNADPDGSPAHLFKRAETYLLGYLTKEENMAEIIDVNASRVLSHGILARNGLRGRAYSLDGSAGDPWIGAELTLQFIQDIFNSPEATNWRDSTDPSSVRDINAQLDSIEGLNSQIEALKKELGQQTNTDPNNIVITQKGWTALYDAIKSFFSKNN